MADLIFARPDGQWFDFPPLKLAAMSGDTLVRPGKLDLMPLPPGATLTLMPTCAPVGFDPESGEYRHLGAGECGPGLGGALLGGLGHKQAVGGAEEG